MAIRVTCSNRNCGKVLVVRNEYAGKKGTCPSCGRELVIPAADSPEARAETGAAEGYVRPAYTGPVEPVGEPAARQGGHDNLEASDLPRRPKPISAMDIVTRLGLGLGIAALLMLSLSPVLNWVSIPKSKTGGLGNIQASLLLLSAPAFNQASTPVFYFSAGLVLVVVAALGLSESSQRELADAFVGTSSSAAAGWGLLSFLWLLGLMWKIFTISSKIKGNQEGPSPGAGLILGLLSCMTIIAVFGGLALMRKRFISLGMSSAVGLIVGLLVLIINVKPWESLEEATR
jgi:hypothetical protein